MEWLFYQYISNIVSPFNSCLRKTSECWIETQACWSNLSSNIFCCLIRQMTLRRLRDHRINLISAGVRSWSDFCNHVKGLRDAVSVHHVQSFASFFLWERSQQIWRKPNRPEVLTCHLDHQFILSFLRLSIRSFCFYFFSSFFLSLPLTL